MKGWLEEVENIPVGYENPFWVTIDKELELMFEKSLGRVSGCAFREIH